jgi:hypothetical protein
MLQKLPIIFIFSFFKKIKELKEEKLKKLKINETTEVYQIKIFFELLFALKHQSMAFLLINHD